MKWFDVSEATVVWAPIGTTVNKRGEEKTRFSRLGVKVEMADGSWWFHSFKHGSFTQHFPQTQAMDRLGRPAVDPKGKPVMLPEKVNRFSNLRSVFKEFENRPQFVQNLTTALATAMVEDKK
jgi:hypothetical protein